MLANKKQRARIKTLKKRADFLLIQNSGHKWVSHGFVIQVKPASSSDNSIRVGYTVTKKIDKSSVNRNRIKRRMRAIAAEVLACHGKDGFDYILVGRPLTLTREYADLRNDLIWCLKKMDLYMESPQKINAQ